MAIAVWRSGASSSEQEPQSEVQNRHHRRDEFSGIHATLHKESPHHLPTINFLDIVLNHHLLSYLRLILISTTRHRAARYPTKFGSYVAFGALSTARTLLLSDGTYIREQQE